MINAFPLFPCIFSLHNAYVYEIHNLHFHWYCFLGGWGRERDKTKWGFDNLRTDFNSTISHYKLKYSIRTKTTGTSACRSTMYCCSVRFQRWVAYQQFTRLLWDFIGRSRRYSLPCCAYTKIQKHFPAENGQYHSFEDDKN